MVKRGKADLPHPYLHHATNKIVQPLVLTAMTIRKGKDYVGFLLVCMIWVVGIGRWWNLFYPFTQKEKKMSRTVVNMGQGIQEWTR